MHDYQAIQQKFHQVAESLRCAVVAMDEIAGDFHNVTSATTNAHPGFGPEAAPGPGFSGPNPNLAWNGYPNPSWNPNAAWAPGGQPWGPSGFPPMAGAPGMSWNGWPGALGYGNPWAYPNAMPYPQGFPGWMPGFGNSWYPPAWFGSPFWSSWNPGFSWPAQNAGAAGAPNPGAAGTWTWNWAQQPDASESAGPAAMSNG